VQGGEERGRRTEFLGRKEDRAITGLIILGFFGFVLSGTNGAIAGAIAGAAIGYLWDKK